MQRERRIAERLAELSPEKKAALETLLRSKVARANDLEPRAEGERVPLAYGQRRLWLLDQMNPGNAAYNETNSMRFPFALDIGVFRRSVNEIIRRHESLRMNVEVIDGRPFQNIAPSLSLIIPLSDLRHMPPAEREPEVLRLAAEQSRVPFNLSEGPLLRGSVYRLDIHDYLFVLTMHHMVCDGWSLGVFMVELVTLYWSFVSGKPSPLPEPRIQYGDYAVWQHRTLSLNRQQSQLAYWREQLKELPTLELSTDRPRPAEFTFRGARCRLEIAGSSYASLTTLAARQNVTLFMVLLAVFAVLLHRYSEQEDIAIGVPVGGRPRKELESLIGFFVNTLVMRVKVRGDPTFLQVLEHVRETATTAYNNQDVPFERLVEELQPRRDKSRSPLYQVMLQLFQKPSATGLQKDALLPFIQIDSGTAKFDLSMELLWTEELIQGYLEYNIDLFDSSRMNRMVAHFHQLIESVTNDPSKHISELALLTPEEESQLLEWNRSSAPYPRDRTVPEIFREQVERTPEAPAVHFGAETLSYRELGEKAQSLAAELARRGIKPGDLVGLYLDRSLELPAALLGILEAGGAYVPLDPDYPRERISYLLADSGVKAIVTTKAKSADLAEFDAAVIVADDAPTSGSDATTMGVGRSATHIAYVMYTSGTTGQPKGVAVTHRNILRLVKNVRYVNCDSQQTVLQFAPLAFDASTFEIWGCLLNGGKLTIHPPGIPSLDELGAFIKAEKISLLFLTTNLFRQMIEHRPVDMRGVRQVMTGGETMFVTVAQAAWRALPRSFIINAYGPTECTTYATTYIIGRPETLGDAVPIGKPIENTTAYILDRYGNLMPVGVPGELYLGGDGVAAGYWRRPELTEERFVPDPFHAGGQLYRTGDIVCYREDGNLLFIGRRDRQIKINGYRVELGEVEAAILSHSDVSAVAVVLSATEEKRLNAFCEVHAGKTLSLSQLRSHLSRRLPHYMLPSNLEVVDHLPLTANGKVDVNALSNLKSGAASERDGFVAPRNATEKALSEIWTELLQLERIGVTESFFDVGGHSLIATRLLSRVRNVFEAQISMREFFDNPTIESLAGILKQRMLPSQ
jgi:aspartate racemase